MGGIPRAGGYWAIAALFTLSGGCGLIYQVIWSRLIVLVFGSATHAIATVLGVFFLGLALGSFLAGKYAKRFANPLWLYGWLEIAIGLYAALFHPILDGAQSVHHALFPLVHDSPLLLTAVRVAVATAVLLPPTVLMGATVPVVGDYLTRSPAHVGRDYGLVFALNTLGAAAGSFASAFFLIPAIGLGATTRTAAALNVAVGGISLWLARGLGAKEAPAVDPERETAAALPPVSPKEAYACFVAFALTGFLGLVYEVAWSRALILVFGTSVYAFATMLTTYLVGLAFGSLVMGRVVDRIGSLVKAFILVQVVVGLTVFASTAEIGRLPEQLMGYFRQDTPWRTVMGVEFAVCFAIMIIPAFGSGMLFPLVARVFMGQRKFNIGRTIADSYAVNTVGCIAGSFAAGFLLIPLVGIEMTLLLGAAANLLLAAWLSGAVTQWSRNRKAATVALLIAAAGSGLFLMRTWKPLTMNAGVYVYGESLSRMEQGLDTFVSNYELLYYREGPSATVAVLESPRGRFLRVNGKTDGGALRSGRSDDLTQSFLGILPLLYRPDAERALVIGLGTGMTLDAVLSNGKTGVDCIEISPAVAEAARYFAEANGNALESDRVRLRLLDGRTWLAAMPDLYDVIVSEPSHPWQTGNANLFTRDFFESSIRQLRPGGVFCQWLPYYHMDKEHFKTLVKTMHGSYPYVNVWIVSTDAILIGSREPLSLDWPAMERLAAAPAFANLLGQLDISSLAELTSFFYLDTAAVDKLTEGVTAVNSDDHPLIEYAAPKYLLRQERGEAFVEMLGQSVDAKLPFVNVPAGENVSGRRLLARERYYRNWGFDENVFEWMIRNAKE